MYVDCKKCKDITWAEHLVQVHNQEFWFCAKCVFLLQQHGLAKYLGHDGQCHVYAGMKPKFKVNWIKEGF